MKITMLIVLMCLINGVNLFADKHVNGYYKSNGTYVQPYYKSNSNNTKNDNFSTYGNTNPYTGEKGTKKGDSYNYSGSSSNKNYGYGK